MPLPHRRTLVAAGIAVAALLAPAGSRGQNLEISPVVVELSTGSPSAVVSVKNIGATPMRYQIKPYAWSEARDGKSNLVPTEELAVFPTLFQLAPGATRKVRVGATVAAGSTERAWRIMIEELPDAVSGPGHKIVLQTRFSVPVFLAPLRPEPALKLSLGLEGSGLTVVAANGGNVRQRPASIAVRLLDANGAQLKELEVAPWYVLPGSERAFDARAPKELCGRVSKAVLVAEVGGRKVEASQDFPSGACGP